jgi:hypothetical protein
VGLALTPLPFKVLRVWRLVPPMGVFSEALKQPARFSGGWHRVAASLVYAYESPELAAQSLGFKVGTHTPRELCRECIQLPLVDGAHEWVSCERASDIMSGRETHEGLGIRDLAHYMQRMNRLSIWIPSEWELRQHVVLLNPHHAAISDVQVTSRMLALEQPTLAGHGVSDAKPRRA